MRIALIGDIHGNKYALDAVLERCEHEKIDEYVFLGDYIMDGPYSNEVLDTIKNISSYIISGNKERFIINYPADTIEYKQMAVAHWTYKKLRQDNIEFISNMPSKLELNVMEKKYIFLIIQLIILSMRMASTIWLILRKCLNICHTIFRYMLIHIDH